MMPIYEVRYSVTYRDGTPADRSVTGVELTKQERDDTARNATYAGHPPKREVAMMAMAIAGHGPTYSGDWDRITEDDRTWTFEMDLEGGALKRVEVKPVRKLHAIVDDHRHGGFHVEYRLECRCGWRSTQHYSKQFLLEQFVEHLAEGDPGRLAWAADDLEFIPPTGQAAP